MRVAPYLRRLGYQGPTDATLQVLRDLHRAHLETIPFENLSIHHGERIELDEAWLFDKLVDRRRGGFCYELNGLFAALLRELGFAVARLAARVYDGNGDEGIPFDHMTLKVSVDNRDWLADVGFGDCFIQPIPLDAGPPWQDVRRSYRLVAIDDRMQLQEQRDAEWKPQYIFHHREWQLADFAAGCHYHQTSPSSPFTRRRIASRLTPTGRVSMANDKHIVTHADGTKTETIVDDARRAAILERELGISSRL